MSQGATFVDEKMHDDQLESTEAGAANAGTIIVEEGQTGRAALRPQPSNDPNDPLVSRLQVLSFGEYFTDFQIRTGRPFKNGLLISPFAFSASWLL